MFDDRGFALLVFPALFGNESLLFQLFHLGSLWPLKQLKPKLCRSDIGAKRSDTKVRVFGLNAPLRALAEETNDFHFFNSPAFCKACSDGRTRRCISRRRLFQSPRLGQRPAGRAGAGPGAGGAVTIVYAKGEAASTVFRAPLVIASAH